MEEDPTEIFTRLSDSDQTSDQTPSTFQLWRRGNTKGH